MKKILQVIIVLIDYLLMAGAAILVLWNRTPEPMVVPILKLHAIPLLPLFVGWIIVFIFFDLYNLDFSPRITRVVLAIAICVILSSVIFYLFPIFIIAPKTNLILIGILSTVAIVVWRKIIDYIFIAKFHGHEVMVAVCDQGSFDLVKILSENPRYKYKILGILTNPTYYKQVQEIFKAEDIFTDVLEFEQAIIDKHVQTIICGDWWFSRLYSTVYNLLPRPLRMMHIISFYEKVFSYIPIHSISQYWVMANMDVVSHRVYVGIKRILDILFAVLSLPFTLPICCVVALLISFFGGKGPILFKQERVGQNNKLFTLIKFRTMQIDAEKSGEQWAVKDDPRVTKIGRILRNTRLDELPQIFNIIKGDMSFIGPRPERMVFVEKLTKHIPHYHLRHMIKPGLSGWAQVNHRYTSDIEDTAHKVSYDLFYVKCMNFFIDSQIFIKTIITVLTAKGQ